jgi:hypothetical protein
MSPGRSARQARFQGWINVGGAATRIASGPTTRKTSNSAQPAHFSIVDAHFISSHECYVTANMDSGSGSDARRVDRKRLAIPIYSSAGFFGGLLG